VLVALQCGFMYLPFMRRIFGTAPLDLESWALSALVGAVILPVIAVEKRWRGRRMRKATPRRPLRPLERAHV
jgi:Cation transporting ATPase, C-terminus